LKHKGHTSTSAKLCRCYQSGACKILHFCPNNSPSNIGK